MRSAVDFSLQGNVMRKVISAVSRRGPVRPDLARIFPQQAPGLDARRTASRPIPFGVMVSLERRNALAIPRNKGPNSVAIHQASLL
jgi:hypothetical protein